MRVDHVDEQRPLHARMQALSSSQQSLERHLAAELDVDHAGLMVVNYLIGTESSATPSELAGIAGVSPAVMSLVLRRLEGAGHVTRAPHPGDRRKVFVTTTPASAAAAISLIQPVIGELATIESDLTEHDRAVIERFLLRVTSLYENVASSNGHHN